METVAGDGTPGYQDGNAPSARFNSPLGMVLDSQNNLLVVDRGNRVIRRISSDRTTVSTLVGNGEYGSSDGRGTNASFRSPCCITTLQSGDFLVSDWKSIRRMTAEGEVSTLYTGKHGITGVVEDSQGRIIFCNYSGHTLGMLDKDGTTTIRAGKPGMRI